MRCLLLLVFVAVVYGYKGYGEVSISSFVFIDYSSKPINQSMAFYNGYCNGTINNVYNADIQLYTGISTNVSGHLCFTVNGTTSALCNGSALYIVEQNTNTILISFSIDMSLQQEPIDLGFCYVNKQPSVFEIVVNVPGECKDSGEDILFSVISY